MLRKILAVSLMSFAATAAAKDYETMKDQTWVSLTGEVATTSDSSFVLDYGKGYITVEMDDWQWYDDEGEALLTGYDVTVYGEVDNDLAEEAKIEASSVYVKNLDSYFYASAADEESGEANVSFDVIAMDSTAPIDVNGTVTKVNDVADEVVIGSGKSKVVVDVSMLPTNPLDSIGFQKVTVGDYVSVSGQFTDDLTGGMQLQAERLTTAEIF
ncbi:hypothetical protein CWI84_03880 [Idiomarina tyrosinivorans]|uniref:DUF5666 domain-containing protein n=1 Tax=Idiomarina tyrosinivorans TaxID=1445662 RepID=A0A432ZS85_9GAMM|nr:NirD/YgiW/YdeI family stress tolerance protein [Idiomarina tyrosinivorans]RUO80733.1 hypothetical protein CWI84_03880 [Idiomarina tyrosinivorans]